LGSITSPSSNASSAPPTSPFAFSFSPRAFADAGFEAPNSEKLNAVFFNLLSGEAIFAISCFVFL